MGRKHVQHGFDLVRSPDPPHRYIARFQCTRCPTTIDVRPSDPLNPEGCAKRAIQQGWEADGYRPSVARCPSCCAPTRKPASNPPEAPQPRKESAAPMAPPDPAKPPALRDPTQAERMKIRAILDRQFDDSQGCYLDGYSDQKIGEELGIPWAMVSRLREAAYGPIRVDPVIAALRSAIAGLEQRHEAIAAEITALKANMATFEKKRGA